MTKDIWCNYPGKSVPAPGEVGVGFKATCPCGKRVSVTVRGLYWRHKKIRRSSTDANARHIPSRKQEGK